MHDSDASEQPSRTDTEKLRTVSSDDYAELGVLAESILHAQRKNTTAGLGFIVQRLRHIMLRIVGVKE
jgi:hypothetical protein